MRCVYTDTSLSSPSLGVSLTICLFCDSLSFKKMRQFRPMSAVRETLKQSTVVEVVGTKKLKRKSPLTKPITVVPTINENRKKKVIPENKQWLTKGMLKPTGFEDYATDGPVAPEGYEQERQDYDPENSFTHRIELAITRFCARRTMHQETRKIFEKFMLFGGIDSNQRQFTGRLDEKSMEDYTKKEIAELTAYYGVSETVLDGFYADNESDETTWTVDFEAIAKGFLSSQFTNFFDWYDGEQITRVTNVLRNFYNYLLHHEVCPEYKDQIVVARAMCDVAEEELVKLREVDRRLPGGFNSACSTLFEGNYAGLCASGGWDNQESKMGWSDEDAEKVVTTGIFAHGTEEQLVKLEKSHSSGEPAHVIFEGKVGLEVVGIQLAAGEVKKIYDDPTFTDTYIRPMGKLICKRWNVPHAPPVDLPDSVEQGQKGKKYEFLVEEETLKFCYPGLKFEAVVKELDLGIAWIDYLEATYASFFTWLPNERIREWKRPGPPKQWMRRQMGGEAPGDEGQDVVPAEEDDDLPD